MKIPEDTSTFRYYNANPKNKHTTDCVVRAICTELNQSYEQTAKELTDLWLKTGNHISDVKCYGKYLESKGYIKNKQPRKTNNRKYTGTEFVQVFKDVCVAHIGGHHMVCIKDGKVLDTWNSTRGSIGNYWTKQG